MGLLDTIGLTRKITRPRLEAFLQSYATDIETLDIGSGNKPYRHLFPNLKSHDIAERPGHPLDYTGDAHDLHMIPSQSFDVILCTEVLEHLHTPAKAIAEFHRILRPNGLLLLTTRFIYPVHEAPIDYYRYTEYGLRHLLADFAISELRAEANSIETLAVLYQRIGFQCETLGFRPFKFFWFLLAKITMFFSTILTAQYSDIHHSARVSDILCSGYYVAARRR